MLGGISMNRKDDVIKQIHEAFDANHYPGDSFIQGSFEGCEPYDEVGSFKAGPQRTPAGERKVYNRNGHFVDPGDIIAAKSAEISIMSPELTPRDLLRPISRRRQGLYTERRNAWFQKS